MRLTVAMPTFDDYHGADSTCRVLRKYFSDCVDEILVVDNHPAGRHGDALRFFCHRSGVKYVPLADPVGSCPAKNSCFANATGDYVLLIDSHVYFDRPPFGAGAIRYLRDYFASAAHDPRDMVCGPLYHEGGGLIGVKQDRQWRGQMWGVWADDSRVHGEPLAAFAIWGHGTGCFAMKRESWPGFDPDCRGFAGEEGAIHEIVRSNGGRVMLLPGLKWEHRFGPENNVRPYPMDKFSRVRNYALNLTRAGVDLREMRDYFVSEGYPAAEVDAICTLQYRTPQEMYAAIGRPAAPTLVASGVITARTRTPAGSHGSGVLPGMAAKLEPDCPTCPGGEGVIQSMDFNSVEDWFTSAAAVPHDINEHVPVIAELAAGSGRVLDVGYRPHHTYAAYLKAGVNEICAPKIPGRETATVLALTDCIVSGFDPAAPGRFGLVFLDTEHDADTVYGQLTAYGLLTDRYIILHDSVTFGEKAGDAPGMMYGVRRFLREHPEFTVIKALPNNNGLLVLSCADTDKITPPPLAEKAVNYLGSWGRWFKAQLTGEETKAAPERIELRLAQCDVCPARTNDICGLCGCPVKKKVLGEQESCPLEKW